MKKRSFINSLLNPTHWWLPLLIIFVISAAGVTMIGIHTYTQAPPIPSYVSSKGEIIFSTGDILKGQAVFQKYALMEYGSMFGDGANRGPDFTAEALHQVSLFMEGYYQSKIKAGEDNDLLRKGISGKVKEEIKSNTYNKNNNTVCLTDAQLFAVRGLERYYNRKFTDPSLPGAFQPRGYIINYDEIRSLTAFFLWGAWVCGVERPGKLYSYTHNWPYDQQAGNTPTAPIILWSIIGSLGLVFGLGIVLYYHGKLEKLDDNAYTRQAQSFMTKTDVRKFNPDSVQRATYKFFCVAILLFAV